MHPIDHEQDGDGDDSDRSSDVEINLEKFKLNDAFRKYSLEKCLETSCFRKLIENFGAQNILYFCENFGVTNVTRVKEYEKNPHTFFANLLRDYAVNTTNVEKAANKNDIYSLSDLQLKLWKLNNGKLMCKLIKENESGKKSSFYSINEMKLKIESLIVFHFKRAAR